MAPFNMPDCNGAGIEEVLGNLWIGRTDALESAVGPTYDNCQC